MMDIRHRFTALFDRLGRVPLGLHQLLFRLAIAGVFLKAGMVKVASWDATLALFRRLLAEDRHAESLRSAGASGGTNAIPSVRRGESPHYRGCSAV